jgi:Ca-activated chloride channel homolog
MLFSAQRKPQPSTPLAHTELQVTPTDLVAEYVLRHHFQNTGTAPIEAVFSFPVPLDAAFLGMQATLGGQTVVAQIQAQHQASRTYGDAIAQGTARCC